MSGYILFQGTPANNGYLDSPVPVIRRRDGSKPFIGLDAVLSGLFNDAVRPNHG
jgi:hypothetical protein